MMEAREGKSVLTGTPESDKWLSISRPADQRHLKLSFQIRDTDAPAGLMADGNGHPVRSEEINSGIIIIIINFIYASGAYRWDFAVDEDLAGFAITL
jgi:hypothetical protein